MVGQFGASLTAYEFVPGRAPGCNITGVSSDAAMTSSFIHGMLVPCLISLSLWAQDQPKAASHIVTPGQTRRPAPLTRCNAQA